MSGSRTISESAHVFKSYTTPTGGCSGFVQQRRCSFALDVDGSPLHPYRLCAARPFLKTGAVSRLCMDGFYGNLPCFSTSLLCLFFSPVCTFLFIGLIICLVPALSGCEQANRGIFLRASVVGLSKRRKL